MTSITIDGRPIGHDHPPYIIAEMSANHGGSLERALKIVDLAAACGADAIKLQAYTADSMTLDCDMPGFTIEGDNPWKGRRLHELYGSAATPYEWMPRLYAVARERGITPFATPFGADAIEVLEAAHTPAYKIASFEAVDLELVAACAATGKPMIISTGLCTAEEIGEALEAARAAGATEIALLKCNSAYPASVDEANLATIADMAARFGVPIGFSDHTLGTATAAAACALGACIIEKHVIDDREPPTPDSEFSAVPEELTRLVRDCREVHRARGEVAYGPTPRERGSLVFRRSLYAVTDIEAGESLALRHIRSVRPGYGLAPKHRAALLGRRVKRTIRRGEPLDWDMVE